MQKIHRRLDDTQRGFIEDFRAKYTTPMTILRTKLRSYYVRAKATGFEDDDIEQICWLGTVRAAHTYEPARNIAFATYARRAITSCLNEAIIYEVRRRGDLVVRSNFDTDRRSLDSLPGRNDDPLNRLLLSEWTAALPNVLKTLDVRSRRIVEMKFGLFGNEPLSIKEIAAEFRIGKIRVHQIVKAAVETMMEPARRYCGE